MTYRIVPRTEIGLPETVTSSSGKPRPALHLEPMIIFHYTGVSSRDYDTADVAAEVRRIQQVFSATKPFEYNYVIGQAYDDNIYEFAGTYQAAHSAGENSTSFGVLFLNSTREPLTCVQTSKYRWLRDVLIWTQHLAVNPEQLGHRDAPGAATACPGRLIWNARDDLAKPWEGSYSDGFPCEA